MAKDNRNPKPPENLLLTAQMLDLSVEQRCCVDELLGRFEKDWTPASLCAFRLADAEREARAFLASLRGFFPACSN